MYGRRILSVIVVNVILGFLLWIIIQNWGVVRSFPWRLNLYDLFLMVIILVFVYPIDAFSWHRLIRALGQNVDYLTNLKIWMVSNSARFIPGIIWQYAGRLYFAQRYGVPKVVGMTAIVLESVFVVGLGTIVVVITFILGELPVLDYIKKLVMPFIALYIVLVVAILVALSSKRFINKFALFIRIITGKKIKLTRPRLLFYSLPVLFISFLFQFVTPGSVLFFLARNAIDLSIGIYPIFIGMYALAWLLGYITVFAPSGLGVQEVTLAGLLSLYMPFAIAGIVAIAFRVLLLGSEAVVLMLVLLIRKEKPLIFL